jgi:small nuclear ribonucleoprotein (snRNP)-like protein
MLRIRGNGGGTLEKPLKFVKPISGRGLDGQLPTIIFHSGSPITMSLIPSNLLETMIGQVVVVDLRSTYVCLGTLVACDGQYLEIRDADLHDFRDSTATREVYTYDSVRFGIRRNRQRTLIRQDDVVAISRFDEIAES